MRKNIYIFFAILFFAFIFWGNITQPVSPSGHSDKEFFTALLRERISNSPEKAIPLAAIAITYFTLFAAGVLYLIYCAKKIIAREPLMGTSEIEKPFPLNEERAAQLLFLIMFFIFLLEMSGTLFYKFIKALPVLKQFRNIAFLRATNFAIAANLIIEIMVIGIITAFLKPPFLFSLLKKNQVAATLKIYIAMVPIFLATAILNSIAVEALGIKYSFNPAIKLILLSKDFFFSLLVCLQIIIAGPLAEELFFRGFIYRLIKQKYSFWPAAFLTSIFFILPHGTPQHLLPLLVISLCLCYVYEKTQNILIPAIFHSIFNTASLAALLTVKSLL